MFNLHVNTLNLGLYSSPNIISMIKSRRIKWSGHTAWMGMRNTYVLSVEKCEGERSLGGPRCTWEDNIKLLNM